ncbi:unnamed protein product [Timema podura]|uniref:Uncharacterized protein n=1 Tax=Timema podura TaxID=61482 RepID=A0ABN7NJG6_TIMPD|nr:unnamed protein product [Timema podura]
MQASAPHLAIPKDNGRPQNASFSFHLTPQQATDVTSSRDCRLGGRLEFVNQIQMRFCQLETSCEQEDFMPPGLGVNINGQPSKLPLFVRFSKKESLKDLEKDRDILFSAIFWGIEMKGEEVACQGQLFMSISLSGVSNQRPFIPSNKQGVEPKRSNRPVDITTYVKLSPLHANYIDVGWNSDYGSAYVIAVYLVRMLVTADLLQRMRAKGARQSDFTRGLIKEKLSEDADSEIATTSLRVSLVCPLGKMRMVTPCRASTCYHLQCFDANTFLQMNERKPTWMCPVCDKPALYDNLMIDGYFQDVLSSSRLTQDSTEIQLHQDGSWSTLAVKVEHSQAISPVLGKSATKIEVISDDLEVITDSRSASSKDEPKKHVDAVTVDLTLSDSDEETETVTKNKVVEEKTDSSNQSSPPSKQETGAAAAPSASSTTTSTNNDDVMLIDLT